MWKDFFYFKKSERLGIITLILLITIIIVAVKWYQPQSHNNEFDNKILEKKYLEYVSKLNVKKNQYKRKEKRKLESCIILTKFDPNKASKEKLRQLGLSKFSVHNILKYREKGGKFHHSKDLSKIYGITKKQFNTLLPYIVIDTLQEEKRCHKGKEKKKIELLKKDRREKTKITKFKKVTVIDINRTDTTVLKKIPGIGSYLASKIIHYRDQLGGFYDIAQLEEIDLKSDLLKDWFSIDKSAIKKVNINRLSLKQLMYHPYINFYQAKIIIEYRSRKGNIKSLRELVLYDEFAQPKTERLLPYVTF